LHLETLQIKSGIKVKSVSAKTKWCKSRDC